VLKANPGDGKGTPRHQERCLPTVKLLRPTYSDKFRCIGALCEDNCCSGNWAVTVDQASYEKYKSMTDSPLFPILEAAVIPLPEESPLKKPSVFAIIETNASGFCPLFSDEGLCRLQLEHGFDALCTTCKVFPRSPLMIDSWPETALSLSCPEAARLILLDPDLAIPPVDCKQFPWDDTADPSPELRSYFWHIREFIVKLIRNRSYPLWQRMFLLGTFSRRLDAMAHGQLDRGFPAFLRDFSAAIADGSLRATMETIAPDLALQLDMIVSLVNLCLTTPELARHMPPRLQKTLQAFGQGIGDHTGATPASKIAKYKQAWENYANPFFQKHPHFLENYLLNQIYRNLFPFGKDLFFPQAVPAPASAYSRLATHYALIKTILIGVAGFHKETFTTEIAVEAVESVYRYFEHNITFLDNAHELLVKRQLNNARGLTMLLRN
jgi:lysine-N-methylase